ncbi:hypothetical protein [Catelliglobosispora koreensis]|uniref:hypothetical protein n=1 Tax=Catelliglobosispora koreensis TaxID=129052 RepID=UPI00035F8936|nr:hypothetical protein [Catelliglobosispora koreensis]
MTRFIAAALLSLTLLAGCSSDNVSCGIDECKVTFDRGVSASASVLGVEAKLVSAEGDNVTLEVAGEQITLTTGQTGTEVAGLMVYLDKVSDTQVVVRIARN